MQAEILQEITALNKSAANIAPTIAAEARRQPGDVDLAGWRACYQLSRPLRGSAHRYSITRSQEQDRLDRAPGQ